MRSILLIVMIGEKEHFSEWLSCMLYSGKGRLHFIGSQLLMSPEILCAESFPLVCAAASSPKCEAVYSKLDCVSPPFVSANKSLNLNL